MAITNAHDSSRSRSPDIERGTIVIAAAGSRRVGAERAGAGGREGRRRGRRGRLSGLHQRATQIGLNEPGPRGFEDVNEMLDFNPQLRTRVAYHAESDAIPVARANGITTVARDAGRRHLRRRGRGDESRRLDVGRSDAQAERGITSTSRRSAAAADAAGAVAEAARRGRDRTYDDLKRTATGGSTSSRSCSNEARAYAKAGPTRPSTGRSKRSCRWSRGTLPLVVHGHRAQDIRDAVAFADRVKVKIVISGGTEAATGRAAAQGEEHPGHSRQRADAADERGRVPRRELQLAGELAKAGVKVAFSTGDSAYVAHLPVSGRRCRSRGAWIRDEAIKALTINAAEILGVADRVGSLEAGKDANLFISKGDPLEVKTVVTHVIIDGQGRRPRQQALSAVPEVHRAAVVRSEDLIGDRARPSDSNPSHGPVDRCRLAPLRRYRRALAFASRRAPTRRTSMRSGARLVTAAGRGDCSRDDRDTQRPHRRGRRRRRSHPPTRGSSTAPASTVYPGLIDMGNAAGLDIRSTAAAAAGHSERSRKPSAASAARSCGPSSRRPRRVRPDAPELSRLAAAGVTDGPRDADRRSSRARARSSTSRRRSTSRRLARSPIRERGLPRSCGRRWPCTSRFGGGGRGGGYPVSLLGDDRVRRQSFLDAQHQQLGRTALRRSEDRHRRGPPYDPSLDAIQPALGAQDAGGVRGRACPRDPARAEHGEGIQPGSVITGAREADKVVAGSEGAKRAGHLQPRTIPTRSRTLAPDADEPIRELRLRAQAPKTPAALEKSGVLFAFSSDGFTQPRDFVRNAARAVKDGLAAEAAVRALDDQRRPYRRRRPIASDRSRRARSPTSSSPTAISSRSARRSSMSSSTAGRWTSSLRKLPRVAAAAAAARRAHGSPRIG